MGHFDGILDKVRENIPALSSPQSTFDVTDEGCEEGFIKIIAYDSFGGPSTGVLNCQEVELLIEVANAYADLIGGASES